MPKLPPFDDLVAAFLRGGASALGGAAVKALGEELRSLWASFSGPEPPAPRISRPALDQYIQNDGFAPFVKKQVERWILWTLADMPHAEASMLLLAAATASNGKLDVMLRTLAQHFRPRV